MGVKKQDMEIKGQDGILNVIIISTYVLLIGGMLYPPAFNYLMIAMFIFVGIAIIIAAVNLFAMQKGIVGLTVIHGRSKRDTRHGEDVTWVVKYKRLLKTSPSAFDFNKEKAFSEFRAEVRKDILEIKTTNWRLEGLDEDAIKAEIQKYNKKVDEEWKKRLEELAKLRKSENDKYHESENVGQHEDPKDAKKLSPFKYTYFVKLKYPFDWNDGEDGFKRLIILTRRKWKREFSEEDREDYIEGYSVKFSGAYACTIQVALIQADVPLMRTKLTDTDLDEEAAEIEADTNAKDEIVESFERYTHHLRARPKRLELQNKDFYEEARHQEKLRKDTQRKYIRTVSRGATGDYNAPEAPKTDIFLTVALVAAIAIIVLMLLFGGFLAPATTTSTLNETVETVERTLEMLGGT